MNRSLPRYRRRAGVVAVITRADQFLVIRRSRLVRAPRAICFPGGGVEPGETEADALLRELREEIQARARAVGPIWRSESASGLSLAWWQADLLDDEPLVPNPAEVESIHWWSFAELVTHPDLLPTNRDFLAAWQRQEIPWQS